MLKPILKPAQGQARFKADFLPKANKNSLQMKGLHLYPQTIFIIFFYAVLIIQLQATV